MRKLIAALQISADGYIEGPNGEMDWAMSDDKESWKIINNTLDSVDTLILGRVMYPDYEKYWMSCLADPGSCSANDIAYARRADSIPHLVLSRTLESVEWKTSSIIRDLVEIRKLKLEQGKDILALGGATLVSGLINNGLLDELHLLVNPLILGGGKALFGDVMARHRLKLLSAKPLNSGKVSIVYGIGREKITSEP